MITFIKDCIDKYSSTHKPNTKKEKNTNKKQIVNHKTKKKKCYSLFSILVYIFFVFFSIFNICLLKSSNVYNLVGQIYYNQEKNIYEIKYNIEDLWNDLHLQVGDKVCTPTYYTRNNSAITKSRDKCVDGTIIKSGNRVIVDYKIPKHISLDELNVFLDKSSDTIFNVKLEIKYFLGKYQITKISPTI